jgi:uncharacterized protein YndB with AHSA1/START domain/uncharacterized protein YciI
MTALPPIHREVLVNVAPDTAFALFTEQIASWWPLAELSVFGEGATVSFTDGALTERSPGGEAAEWGTVTSWRPPEELSLTWHPGRDGEGASQVTVTFTPAGAQTLVVIEHSGWEVFADPAAARAEYEHGWPEVLKLYQEFADAQEAAAPEPAAAAGDFAWVALLHRPGPAAADGPVFTQPQFREHVGFLGQMAARGYLVAAGPLTDQDGEGMTILRVPGPDGLAEATRLATQEDPSVVSEFFTVTVRPWQVMMTAAALDG